MLMGDFNVMLGAKEKKGGRPFAQSEGKDFLDFIERAELYDVRFSSSKYT